MTDCENLQEYCLGFAHLMYCLDELDDVGLANGEAGEELNNLMWGKIKLIYETSKRMLDNHRNCCQDK